MTCFILHARPETWHCPLFYNRLPTTFRFLTYFSSCSWTTAPLLGWSVSTLTVLRCSQAAVVAAVEVMMPGAVGCLCPGYAPTSGRSRCRPHRCSCRRLRRRRPQGVMRRSTSRRRKNCLGCLLRCDREKSCFIFGLLERRCSLQCLFFFFTPSRISRMFF